MVWFIRIIIVVVGVVVAFLLVNSEIYRGELWSNIIHKYTVTHINIATNNETETENV